MEAAIIGLLGAGLGALITLFGGMLTDRRQTRRDEVTWRRDKRAEAYDGALRHMLRAANLRSEFLGGTGEAVLRTEHQREFFDDLVQAQFWLHTAARYCGGDELVLLRIVTETLDTHIALLTSGLPFDKKGFSILKVLQDCIGFISSTADVKTDLMTADEIRRSLMTAARAVAGLPGAPEDFRRMASQPIRNIVMMDMGTEPQPARAGE